MENVSTEQMSWGALTAKLVALNLPVFLLAAIVLVAAVLRVGVRNVFLPGWWRLW